MRYHCLDGIKGVAMVGIVWYHLCQAGLPGGFVGVEVFFVVSGFLLASSLSRELERTGRIAFGRFYLRRLMRLWPALAVMMMGVAALGALLDTDTIVGLPGKSLAALGFATNWHEIAVGGSYFASTSPQLLRHLWFVALLAQMTLIAPFLTLVVFRLVPQRWRVAVPVALALASALLMGLLFDPGSDPTRVYYGTDTHCFAFLAGMALAWAMPSTRRKEGESPGVSSWAFTAPWIATAALVALFVLSARIDQDTTAFRGGLALGAVCAVALVAGSVVPGSWMSGLFEWPPLALLGRYSYGIYLWHWPLFLLWQTALPGWRGARIWVLWLLTLVSSALMAALSWALVERPMGALSNRLRPVVTSRPAKRVVSNAAVRVGKPPVPSQRAKETPRRPWGRVMLSAALALLLVAGYAHALKVSPEKSSTQLELERNQQALAKQNQQSAQQGSNASVDGKDAPKDPDEAKKQAEQQAKAQAEAERLAQKRAKAIAEAQARIAPTIDGSQITVVGDSVAVGAAPALQRLMPSIQIDAAVSRFVWDAPDIVSAHKAQGTLRRFLVLSLNTNSASSVQRFEQIAAAAGKDHVLVIVTGHGERSWIPTANKAASDYVATHPDSAVLADWNAAITPHPEMLASDGIHPEGKGKDLYASTVRDAIAGWMAASEVDAG